MRDALASGIDDPDVPLARALNGRDLLFPNEIIKQDFVGLWNELWDEVRENYDPENDFHREMRTVFLELNDKCLQVLRKLDRDMISPEDVTSNPAFMQFSELTTIIHSGLALGNQSDENVEAFPLPLDVMSEDFSAAIDQLSNALFEGVKGKS